MESYLHKQAKELLFSQITRNTSIFDGRDIGYQRKVMKAFHSKNTEDAFSVGDVYMEFPSVFPYGNYPDECGCNYPNFKNTEMVCCCFSENEHEAILNNNADVQYPDRFSLKTLPGYCKCASCKHLNRKKVIVHDVAAIDKGNVDFAIEVINKHLPAWQNKINLNYPVYIIKAENILKRVDNTPVYVDDIIR